MATTYQGWTVIIPPKEESHPPPTTTKPISSSEIPIEIDTLKKNAFSDSDFSKSTCESSSSSFTPPIATWFDEANSHFVALHANDPDAPPDNRNDIINNIISLNPDVKEDGMRIRWKRWGSSNSQEKNDTPRDDEKTVFYQILRVPRPTSSPPVVGAYDQSSSKGQKVDTTNNDKNECNCLIADPAVPISLPVILVQNPIIDEDDSKLCNQISSYRSPTLAKFSSSQKYLALQFSSTQVRIVPTNNNAQYDNNSQRSHHWTIDLNMDAAAPSHSRSYEFPTFTSKTTSAPIYNKRKNMLIGRIVKSSSKHSDESIEPGITILLPGGVLWLSHDRPSNDLKKQASKSRVESDQEENKSHHNTEMLFLVTNTGLLVYRVIPNQFNSKFVVSKYATIPFVVGSDEKTMQRTPAISFWYEPKGKVLLVGSYDCSSQPSKKCMRISTYFLEPFMRHSLQHHLPPSAQTLSQMTKSFLVGTSLAESEESELIRPDDIYVVNVYGKPFCVELNTLSNKIELHSLDTIFIGNDRHIVRTFKYSPHGFDMGRKQMEFGSNFVSVIDNLIIIHSRENKQSLYLDMADTDVNNYYVIDDTHCILEGEEENVYISKLYDPSFSFLSPCFLLDPQGRGSVHQIAFDLKRFSDNVPWPRCKMTPFFLRRRSAKAEFCHLILLQRVREFIQTNGEFAPEIGEFLDQCANYYSMNSLAKEWDNEACLPFIYKAALLPGSIEKSRMENEEKLASSLSHIIVNKDGDDYSEADMGLHSVVTQSEILQFIILPLSYVSVANSDFARLRSVLNFAISFVGVLQQKSIEPCEALYCIIAALFWRLGDGVDIIGFLRARKFHHRFDNHSLEQHSEYSEDHVDDVNKTMLRRSGMEAFAEMLLMITVESPFGISSFEKKTVSPSKESLALSPEFSDQESSLERKKAALRDTVLTYAVDILCSMSSHRIAARHLLKIGRVIDAVSVCSKVMFDETVTYHRLKANNHNPPQLKFADQGTMAEDFFASTVKASSRMKDLGERARLFHHVCKFLLRWDPESFKYENTLADFLHENRSRSAEDLSKSTTNEINTIQGLQRSTSTMSGKYSRDKFANNRGNNENDTMPNIPVTNFIVPEQTEPLKSNLARRFPEFPDELLGGRNSLINKEVRKMYGFAMV